MSKNKKVAVELFAVVGGQVFKLEKCRKDICSDGCCFKGRCEEGFVNGICMCDVVADAITVAHVDSVVLKKSSLPTPEGWDRFSKRMNAAWKRVTLRGGNAESEMSGLMDDLDDLAKKGKGK